jgi:hypothetical protein
LAAPSKATRVWDCYIDVENEDVPPYPGNTWRFAAHMDLGARGGDLWSFVSVEVAGSLVTVRSEPERLAQGGTFEIVAQVRHEDGTPDASAEVTFETTAGELASRGAPVETDETGAAIDQLTTYETATVTARSGESSASTVAAIGPGPVLVGNLSLSCWPLEGSAPLNVTCDAHALGTTGEPLEGLIVVVSVTDPNASTLPPFPETDANGFAAFEVVNLVNDGAAITVAAGAITSNLAIVHITESELTR